MRGKLFTISQTDGWCSRQGYNPDLQYESHDRRVINHHVFGSIRNAGDAAHIAKSLEAIHLTEEFPPEN